MKKSNIIRTNLAPKAIGAYSQGVLYNNLIFTSGQIPVDIDTGNLISSEFSNQLNQVLKNLKNLIESEGSNINQIISNLISHREAQMGIQNITNNS